MENISAYTKSYDDFLLSLQRLKEFIDFSTAAMPQYLEHLKNNNEINKVLTLSHIKKKVNGSFKRVGFFRKTIARPFINTIVRKIIEFDLEKKKNNLPYHIGFIYEQSFIFLYSIFENYLSSLVDEFASSRCEEYDSVSKLSDKIKFINTTFNIDVSMPLQIDELRIARNSLIHNGGVLRDRDSWKIKSFIVSKDQRLVVDNDRIEYSEKIVSEFVLAIDKIMKKKGSNQFIANSLEAVVPGA